MPGPFNYLHSINPPFPGCDVSLSYDNHTIERPAIIDSGADLTCIPVNLVKQLSLKKVLELDVGGATDKDRKLQSVYHVNLEFLGFAFPHHLVLALEGAGIDGHVLIGRDILNRYRVILAGPDLEFFID